MLLLHQASFKKVQIEKPLPAQTEAGTSAAIVNAPVQALSQDPSEFVFRDPQVSHFFVLSMLPVLSVAWGRCISHVTCAWALLLIFFSLRADQVLVRRTSWSSLSSSGSLTLTPSRYWPFSNRCDYNIKFSNARFPSFTSTVVDILFPCSTNRHSRTSRLRWSSPRPLCFPPAIVSLVSPALALPAGLS